MLGRLRVGPENSSRLTIEPGQVLSHYRLIEKIGEGGMGVVYRARDERLERDVALKVLPTGALADQPARRQFRKEALALSRLNHPNIATVHDFDRQDGVDFMVMEYVAGETLARKVRAGSLPERDVARLGLQIASALQEAHEHEVIHRDLKPVNVVVTPKGQAKVLDFGLAKLLPALVDVSLADTLSQTQAVTGTLPYMAPEQLRGESVDGRSDLFALGAVLYEMATGRRAFGQDTVPRVTDAVLNRPPVRPRAVNAAVSQEMERIILKCLEKDPENRYQSAKEIIVDLRRLADPAAAGLPSQRWNLPGRKRVALAGLAAGLAAVAMLAWAGVSMIRERSVTHAASQRITSLAVLPLENLTGNAEQQYFVDGMHDALIADLSKIGALRVISRTSVMRYRGTSKSVPEIGRDLGVDAVIEGSVFRAGDQVRITAQLIHAQTDTHLWAESYEGDLRNILAVQRQTAEAVARQIKIVVTPEEKARLSSDRPVSPEAHEAYLKGRFYMAKNNQAGDEKAMEALNRSIALDPTYAPAYAVLAQAYLSRELSTAETAARGRAVASKAIALDDSLAEAHVAMAQVRLYFDWAWADAESELKRAIALDPNSVEAHHQYSHLLMAAGRFDESLREGRRAAELDPLDLPVTNHLAGHYMYARQYDEMQAVAQQTIDFDPTYLYGWLQRGNARSLKGMNAQAIQDIEKAVSLEGRTGEVLSELGLVYARAGRRAAALAILEDLERGPSGFKIAKIFAALGERERAFSWIEKAFAERDLGLVYIKVDPFLDPLRGDPRFSRFVARVGLTP